MIHPLAALAAALPAAVLAHNRRLDRRLQRVSPNMGLKRWKLALKVPAMALVGSLGWYALSLGAEPTIVGSLAIATIGYLVGIDFVELLALVDEARTVSNDGQDSDNEE